MGPWPMRFARPSESVQSASRPRHWNSSRMFMRAKPSLRLRLVRFRFVGDVEGVLQSYQILARFQGIQRGLLGLKLLVGVIGCFDGQTDTPVVLINLDHAGRDFLADLEHVLDFIHALFADL